MKARAPKSLARGGAPRISYVERGAGANGAVTEDLRRYNRGLLLELVSRYGSLSRTDIAKHTQLTGAAISRISRELIETGLIVERNIEGGRAGRGRPAVALELAPERGFVVGVGIGAYEQWVQIASLRGQCVSRRSLELLSGRDPRRSLAALAREIRTLMQEAGIARRRVFGIGVSVAGVVDHEAGVVIDSPNIGWKDVRLADGLHRELGLPTQVEALHHALNLAEAHESVADTVMVNIALGIGASVMEHGRLVRGSHAAAGQIGHMRVADATELCTCGRRGCLDTVASGYAVLRRLSALPSRRVPREHDAADARRLLEAIDRERQGEGEARAAFRACGERLGEALNAVRAVLDPARIILAGPLSQTGSYVEGVRSHIEQLAVGERKTSPPLLYLAGHSSDSAAARLALSTFVFSSAFDTRRLGG